MGRRDDEVLRRVGQWGNTSWLGFYPYLRQAGGAVDDASCNRAIVDSPEAVRALTYYAPDDL